jgi:flagellar basal-body rod modification protein FlgD
MKQTIGMNKDDFLKLFITQLQNQDPLNPMDGTEYMTQLAQLTQLEQAYNTNNNLAGIIASLNASSALSAVSFIGKDITASGSQVGLTAGEDTSINYNAPYAAEKLTVTIRDAKGNVVRTIEAGPGSAGEGSVSWDGKDAGGNRLPSGAYTVAVGGLKADGTTFSCDTLLKGKVDGVSYAGAQPVLTVNGVEIPFSSILRVKEVI